MKKYIDTEWLENNAKEYSLGYYEEDEWATPLNVLDSAPSIDIVRCGECKMWMSEHLCQWWSRYGTVETDADDFCSYGSRSEKPNNCETCKWWEGNTNFCYSKADSDDHACHYEPKDKWRKERSE